MDIQQSCLRHRYLGNKPNPHTLYTQLREVGELAPSAVNEKTRLQQPSWVHKTHQLFRVPSEQQGSGLNGGSTHKHHCILLCGDLEEEEPGHTEEEESKFTTTFVTNTICT